ncbi:sulfur carrier protein ThiS [Klebsiella pneumoniae]
MQIWFNDEPLACADNLSVSALLTQLEQQQPGVALALNQHILPRDRWEDGIQTFCLQYVTCQPPAIT